MEYRVRIPWGGDDVTVEASSAEEAAYEAALELIDDLGLSRAETRRIRVAVDGRPVTVTLPAVEPECVSDDGEHAWGVLAQWGKGGGVVITERCAPCGAARTTDTWYADPDTGEVYRRVEYA